MEPGSFSDTVGVVVDPDLERCLGFCQFVVQLRLSKSDEKDKLEGKRLDQETNLTESLSFFR